MHNFMSRTTVFMFLSLSLILMGCTDKIKTEKDKVYLIATDASYPPFESIDSNNAIVGFEVDVLKAVAQKANIKVQFINTPWEGIFTALAAGDRDMIMSSVTITDERRKSVDFSDPYFEAQQLIAVSPTSHISNLNDLKNKKIAVQNATTGDIAMQNLLGRNNPNIKRFDTMILALQELLNNDVDAAVGDNGVIRYFIKNNPHSQIKVLSDPSFKKEYYGYAVKKSNPELLNKLNAGIKAIKDDGTLKKIQHHYFNEAVQ